MRLTEAKGLVAPQNPQWAGFVICRHFKSWKGSGIFIVCLKLVYSPGAGSLIATL